MLLSTTKLSFTIQQLFATHPSTQQQECTPEPFPLVTHRSCVSRPMVEGMLPDSWLFDKVKLLTHRVHETPGVRLATTIRIVFTNQLVRTASG